MVRALEDGNIEFIGRLDGQVKIRGFRVEIDEICRVIGAEPAVRQCIVVPVRDGGQNRLAAYVVLESGCSEPDQRALELRVHASLPSYMRPAAWIRLDALPMTPNRKIDTKALPLPRFDLEEAYVAPVDELETRVQAAWATVLERDSISVEADFFALGGHSLLLTRVLLRISEGFGVQLSMAELMRARTVREMASLIRAAHAIAAPGPAHQAGMEELAW
jgi:acyl carrier protein